MCCAKPKVAAGILVDGRVGLAELATVVMLRCLGLDVGCRKVGLSVSMRAATLASIRADVAGQGSSLQHEWVLCRYRHNAHNADRRLMPRRRLFRFPALSKSWISPRSLNAGS